MAGTERSHLNVKKFHVEQHADEAHDYFRLTKLVKRLQELEAGTDRTVKVALLADCATQHLAAITRVIAAQRGIRFELFEAEYDTIELEVFNPASALYAFQPDVIVLLQSTEKLKRKFYGSQALKGPADQLQHIESLWDAIRNRSAAVIIQCTYVLPLERPFGHYGRLVPMALDQFVAEINHGMVDAARRQKNVQICDVDFIAGNIGRMQWFDERLWNLAKSPCALTYLPLLAHALVDMAGASAGKVIKCVVLDLDNTLWGGVIGDDGLDGIRLGDLEDGEAFVAFQQFILGLKKRGIILAVCSKNDHANAILPFQQHPDMVIRESDIAVFVANWNNKADNIRHIQQTLNIGADSIVFLDDNPYERNLVRQLFPEIIVPELPEDPALYLRTLAGLNLFEAGTYSSADAERADQYRVEAQRETAKASFERIEDYLQSLDMSIAIERFTPHNLPRIAQLIQRSNQFNLATRRFSEADCERFMRDHEGMFPFTLTLEDKYGNYGLISVVVLRVANDALCIDEYLMSCRVLQRGVENFAMNEIFALARSLGLTKVTGSYRPTSKNGMVRDFYRGFDFKLTDEDSEGNAHWEQDTSAYQPRPALMSVAIHTLQTRLEESTP